MGTHNLSLHGLILLRPAINFHPRLWNRWIMRSFQWQVEKQFPQNGTAPFLSEHGTRRRQLAGALLTGQESLLLLKPSLFFLERYLKVHISSLLHELSEFRVKETSGGLYSSPAEAGSMPFNIHVSNSSLQTVMTMFSRQTSNAGFAGGFTHILGKQISLTFFQIYDIFLCFLFLCRYFCFSYFP